MNLTRRRFLQSLAISSALIPRMNAASTDIPEVGSQLYGWGQYYQREGKNVADHLDEVLSAVRDCGYEYAEASLDLVHTEENAKFASRLKSKGLKPVSLYTGGELHKKESAGKTIETITAAAKVAAANGFKIINCNPNPIGRPKPEDELNIQAENLNTLGAELKKVGLKLGIHNHTPEMQDNAREFHHDLDATDPALVGFCYDVHWVYRGGIAPKEVLPKYGSRIVTWHLRQSRNGKWFEDLAEGDVDYNWIADYVRQHSLARVFTVELAIEAGTKITRSVVENHKRSREFVKKVFGV